jgi:hypothetical protein
MDRYEPERPGRRRSDMRPDLPHPARIYDYLLGGKDNYAPDRVAADAICADLPHLPISMRANRRFMVRAARYLSERLGFRQFLDIGTGLPTSPNLHEVVQAVAPESRVIYVDNDPSVLLHARALLSSTPQGRTGYVQADLLEPEGILSDPQLTATLDLNLPVAVCLLAVLQYVESEPRALDVVARLMRPLAAGSALVLSTVTGDFAPEEVKRGAIAYRRTGIPSRPRTKGQVEALLSGLDVLEPGVVLVHHWRPEGQDRELTDTQIYMYAGMAVKH